MQAVPAVRYTRRFCPPAKLAGSTGVVMVDVGSDWFALGVTLQDVLVRRARTLHACAWAAARGCVELFMTLLVPAPSLESYLCACVEDEDEVC